METVELNQSEAVEFQAEMAELEQFQAELAALEAYGMKHGAGPLGAETFHRFVWARWVFDRLVYARKRALFLMGANSIIPSDAPWVRIQESDGRYRFERRWWPERGPDLPGPGVATLPRSVPTLCDPPVTKRYRSSTEEDWSDEEETQDEGFIGWPFEWMAPRWRGATRVIFHDSHARTPERQAEIDRQECWPASGPESGFDFWQSMVEPAGARVRVRHRNGWRYEWVPGERGGGIAGIDPAYYTVKTELVRRGRVILGRIRDMRARGMSGEEATAEAIAEATAALAGYGWTDDEAEVVRLHEDEGMSYRQIAKARDQWERSIIRIYARAIKKRTEAGG